MATPGEGHDKGPCFLFLPRLGVKHVASIAKIHLCLFPWPGFYPHCDLRLYRFQLAHKPVDGHVAPLETPFFQPLFDGRDFNSLLP